MSKTQVVREGSVWISKSSTGVLGIRPYLIVNSSNFGIVSAVPLTTTNLKGRMKKFRVRVEPSKSLTLKSTSWVKCEFITTLNISDLKFCLGSVSSEVLGKVLKSVSRLFSN